MVVGASRQLENSRASYLFRIIGLLNEAVYLGGIIILFWVMLSPTPYFNMGMNLAKLTPYWVGEGYMRPSTCTLNLGRVTSSTSATSFRFARSVTGEDRGFKPFARSVDGGNTTSRMVWIGVLGESK